MASAMADAFSDLSTPCRGGRMSSWLEEDSFITWKSCDNRTHLRHTVSVPPRDHGRNPRIMRSNCFAGIVGHWWSERVSEIADDAQGPALQVERACI